MNKKKIVAAGGLVINEKNEILFIFRRQHWDLPKGKLDEGETIEACAVREVQEETGLKKVEIISFLCKTYHEYFDKWINEDVVKESWWYLMKSDSSQILIPQTEEDIEKIVWVDESVIGFYLNSSYPSIKEVLSSYNL